MRTDLWDLPGNEDGRIVVVRTRIINVVLRALPRTELFEGACCIFWDSGTSLQNKFKQRIPAYLQTNNKKMFGYHKKLKNKKIKTTIKELFYWKISFCALPHQKCDFIPTVLKCFIEVFGWCKQTRTKAKQNVEALFSFQESSVPPKNTSTERLVLFLEINGSGYCRFKALDLTQLDSLFSHLPKDNGKTKRFSSSRSCSSTAGCCNAAGIGHKRLRFSFLCV